MMSFEWILLMSMLIYSLVTNVSGESCGVNKECTSFKHCVDGRIITDGASMIDRRSKRDVLNDECSHMLDVCCEISNIKETYPIATKCGVLNPNGVGVKMNDITDGQAQFGEFPWMVAVLKKVIIFNQIASVYHSGGSLIHPSVVLTVGQSLAEESKTELVVRAGEWNTQTAREPLPFVESKISSIIIHEKFNIASGTYNIALLFLATPIANAGHINTICLPPPNMNFDDARCFVTGWGKDKFDVKGSYQDILKKIDLPVIERQTCTGLLRKTRLGRHFDLNESLICAGGEAGKDSCTGDGGSPLVCPVPDNEGYYYQAGIVAWGIGCGENNIPGAYTNVAFFADWIREQIQYRGYNASSYTL